ncbi:LptA/OstA family protein [Pseudogemmobacter humi]|uniref:Lipopolysaccharide export system protein LptA n=1 Tax=Pseudogemmobacter humi TaxID=2483812 RepID=A0A3P5X7Y2_9RHOB|nr:LptA/OstA family protein [Pseudogemmobacter humi]VDC23464.1 Lipopolysaccharide export system protein LptA precursor [Pseudogemmobacter humi]
MTLFARALILTLALSAPALAQEANVAFGGLTQDTSLPVEITADTLSVNNADGSAVFSGNVLVGQGEMRLSAAEVRVDYATDSRAIERLHATGGVTIASSQDAAEAREAVYTIDSGLVVMTGDVLLTQGQSALTGQKLTLNLKDGTGVIEGGVSTTFLPGKN